MSALVNFLSIPLLSELVVALLHTLWQGCAIAALLFVFLRAKAAKNADMRYAAAVVSLILIVIFGLATWSIVGYEAPPAAEEIAKPTRPEPIAAGDATKAAQSMPTTIVAQRRPSAGVESEGAAGTNWQAWAMCVWLAGVAVMVGRIFYMVIGVKRIRRQCRAVEDENILSVLAELVASMKIKRRIRIAVVEHILSPGVIGFIEPTLLLPVSMLSGMSTEDIKAVLAHELAHIKRYDCLVNFCQMVVEAILFFNPAVWWISRQIRIEREACCDAATVAVTGREIAYAQLLFDWAGRLPAKGAVTAAMAGFGEDNSEGRMLDRVKRIVVKDHRPGARISWYMTLAMLAAVGAVLFGLWQGTNITVTFAGKLLTPQERIEKSAEIERTHGQPAYDPEYHDKTADEEKVILGGTVRTWDGNPIPDSAYLRLYYRHRNSSTHKSVSFKKDETGQASFSTTAGRGILWLSAHLDGYKPFSAGPFKFEPGDEKTDFEILFERGVYADIQVVDADSGEPVEGVQLIGGHLFRPGGYDHSIYTKTDQEGKATATYVDGVTVKLKASLDGYEKTIFDKIELSLDAPLVLKIRKGLPTTGIVVSKETGEAVVGAEIRIQERYNPHGMSYGRDQGDIVATTGSDGRFNITTLNSVSKYILAVKAKGYAYKFLYDLYPGTQSIRVELENERVIKGRIIGPLDDLPERKGKTVINYCCGQRYDNQSNWEVEQYAPVAIGNDGATFEISDTWGNRLRIGSGRYRKTFDLDTDEIPDPLIIDLSEKLVDEEGRPYRQREVVIDFETPEGAPPIQGNIRINSLDPNSGYHRGRLVDIVDGKVRMGVTIPGHFSFDLADTVGYWFKDNHRVEPDDGEGPFVHKVKAYPAGTIFGEVFEHDGTPAGNTTVGFGTVKKSPLLGDVHFTGVKGKNSSSSYEMETKYSVHPLPLGGEYCVIASRGDMYVVSKIIKLNEKSPIRQIDLVYPKPVALKGKVVTPEGQGIPAVKYDVSFKATSAGGSTRSGRFTDRLGEFVLEEINPDADGEYTFRVITRKDYCPLRMKIGEFDKPLIIQLEAGSVATGQIIETETGWPVPGVEVGAYRIGDGLERVRAEAKTDENGRFRFSNLKKGRTYSLSLEGCKTTNRMGEEITGGAAEELRVEVELYERSKLEPRRPDKVE